MKAIVEICDLYRGYHYAVVITSHGHRCGYIQIPCGHPWQTRHYDDIRIDVHGGVTFSGARANEDGWWIGFDCAHAGDHPDLDAVHKDMRQQYAQQTCTWLGIPNLDIDNKIGVKSARFVEHWCKRMIDQAIAEQDNDK